MTKDKLAIAVSLIFLSVTVAACSRSHTSDKNSGTAKANQTNSNVSPQEEAAIQAAAASPFFKQTVRGDIERAGFEVEKAVAAGSRADWPNAQALLQNAKANVETGLGRSPRYSERDDLEELKGAIDRTIQSIADRSDDAGKQLQELRTRIMTLKVQIPDS
jgi:hypothetical protein